MTARLGWLGLLAGLLGFGSASAQEPPPDARYWSLIEEALAEIGAGHHAEALVLFREAHEEQPSARTLRGIGLMHYELRDYVEAAAVLLQAIDDPRRPLEGDERTTAEEALVRARAFIARVRVEVTPRNAHIVADGNPVRRDGSGAILLNPGPHQLLVSAPGHRTEMRTVDARGGAELELTIPLVREDGSAEVASDGSGEHTGPMATVHVTSEQRELVFHAIPLRMAGQRTRLSTAGGSEVCTAPCDVELPPGTYELGVARGLGRVLSAGRYEIALPEVHVEIGYRDSSIARLIGWIVLGVSLVSTGVFIAMTPLGSGWLGAAAIATVVGVSTTLVLTLRKDAGRVEVTAVH